MVSTPNRNIYYLTFSVLYRIELARGPFLFTISFSATRTTQCKGLVAVLASNPFEVHTTPGTLQVLVSMGCTMIGTTSSNSAQKRKIPQEAAVAKQAST